MAGPFALGAALGRFAKIRCPHCGHVKLAERRPVRDRVCPACHKHFPDPLAAPPKRPRR
jgi:ribosomal protein S27E